MAGNLGERGESIREYTRIEVDSGGVSRGVHRDISEDNW